MENLEDWLATPEMDRQEEIRRLDVMIEDQRQLFENTQVPHDYPDNFEVTHDMTLQEYTIMASKLFDDAANQLIDTPQCKRKCMDLVIRSPVMTRIHTRKNLIRYKVQERLICRCYDSQELLQKDRVIGSFPVFPVYYKYLEFIETSQHPLKSLINQINSGKLLLEKYEYICFIHETVSEMKKNGSCEGCCETCQCICLVCGSLRLDHSAMSGLSLSINNGLGFRRSVEPNLSWSFISAIFDHPGAQCSVGYLFDKIENTSEKYSMFTRQMWRRSGLQGFNVSQSNMECVYSLSKDDELAERWRLLAALNGYFRCMHDLIRSYIFIENDDSKRKIGVKMAILSAYEGYNISQYLLAYHFFNERKYRKSYKWFLIASENGFGRRADRDLGWMMLRGVGCTKDIIQGYARLYSAAISGSILAHKDLSMIHEENSLVPNPLKHYYWQKRFSFLNQEDFDADKELDAQIGK